MYLRAINYKKILRYALIGAAIVIVTLGTQKYLAQNPERGGEDKGATGAVEPNEDSLASSTASEPKKAARDLTM
jgi:hypothetical protein